MTLSNFFRLTKSTFGRFFVAVALLLVMVSSVVVNFAVNAGENDVEKAKVSRNAGEVEVNRRSRALDQSAIHLTPERWKGEETAVIICDMWDRHWCQGATARVGEMAPVLNAFLHTARKKGIAIIHAPSGCMDFYATHAARLRVANKVDAVIKEEIGGNEWLRTMPSEKDVPWPINQADGGCDCQPTCAKGRAWNRQIDIIDIDETCDVISDNGPEIATFLREKGIKNIIMTGVHTNMCVVGRPFGLRRMVTFGQNTVLARDLTDSMYNSRSAPFVSHCRGTELVIEHIEKCICPTILSTDLTGEPSFRFSGDKQTEPSSPPQTME